GDAWAVYPEVPAALDALRARGLRLGVISNWDTRLPAVLGELDLASRFDTLGYSSGVGVEKPDPRIFQRALRDLRVAAEAALRVGASPLEDLGGAAACGMHARLVARLPAAAGARTLPPAAALRDLSTLAAVVAAS